MSFLVWLPSDVSSQELEEHRSEGIGLRVSYENLTSDPIAEVEGNIIFVSCLSFERIIQTFIDISLSVQAS